MHFLILNIDVLIFPRPAYSTVSLLSPVQTTPPPHQRFNGISARASCLLNRAFLGCKNMTMCSLSAYQSSENTSHPFNRRLAFLGKGVRPRCSTKNYCLGKPLDHIWSCFCTLLHNQLNSNLAKYPTPLFLSTNFQ